MARGRSGPQAMTAREALRLGTRGGAEVLGRDDIGSIEPGKCADLAVWATDGLELAGAADPVAGLVFAGAHRVDRLYVGGELVVRGGALVRADEGEIASAHRAQASRFARESHVISLSTHVLDTGAGKPADGVLSSSIAATCSWPRPAQTTTARARRSPRSRPGLVPARLPSALTVLQARRARGRAGGGPLPRPAPRVALLVRELPRQLSADELTPLFSGRTRFVEELAAHENPLEVAEDVALALSEADQVAALATHPRIGEPSEEQRGAEPDVLEELARLNDAYEQRFGFEFVVFVNGRTRPSSCPCCVSGSSESGPRSSRQACASSARSRGTGGR